MVPPTVFLIDPDRAARTVVASVVQGQGLAIDHFGNLEHFLRAYDRGRAGCIIVDVSTPGATGELVEAMRAGGLPLPVIVTVSRPDPALAERAHRAGAVDVLVKPVEPHELWRRIATAIERDHSRWAGPALSGPTEAAVQPSHRAANGITGLLVVYWIAIFAGTHLPNLPHFGLKVWDKTLHFLAFTGLAILISAAVVVRKQMTLLHYLAIIAVIAAYGALDEATQRFVEGRTSDVTDWFADMAGAILGIAMFVMLFKLGRVLAAGRRL